MHNQRLPEDERWEMRDEERKPMTVTLSSFLSSLLNKHPVFTLEIKNNEHIYHTRTLNLNLQSIHVWICPSLIFIGIDHSSAYGIHRRQSGKGCHWWRFGNYASGMGSTSCSRRICYMVRNMNTHCRWESMFAGKGMFFGLVQRLCEYPLSLRIYVCRKRDVLWTRAATFSLRKKHEHWFILNMELTTPIHKCDLVMNEQGVDPVS